MDDEEASRHLEQALLNLPDDYPYKEQAFRAYGLLVIGRLEVVHSSHSIQIHKSGLKTLEEG